MANEVISLQLAIEASNAARTVGEVKKSFKDLNEAIKQAEIGTKEYDQAVFALAKQKDKLMDLRQEINLLNPKDKIQAFVGLTSSIAGGFAAAQGAVALFAGENEDLQKVLVKTQAAVALATGVQQLKEFGRAWELINMIMRQNPILLIVTAIGALTAAFFAFKDEILGTNTELDKMNRAFEEQKNITAESNRILNNRLIAIRNLKGAEIERFNIQKQIIENDIKAAKASLDVSLAKERQTKSELSLWETTLLVAGQSTAAAQSYGKRIIEAEKATKEQKVALDALAASLKDLNIQEANFQNEQAEKHRDRSQKIKDFITQDKKEWNDLLEQQRREQLELDIQLAEEKKKAEDERAEARINANLAQMQADDEAWRKQKDQRLADEKAFEEAKLTIKTAGFDAANSLAILATDNAEALTEAQKVIGLIQIGVDTAVALTGALRNAQSPSPDNIATGGLSGIAKYAVLAAQILGNAAKAKQLIKGAGSSRGNIPRISGGGGGGGGVTPPTVQQPQSGLTLLNPDGSVKGGTGDQTIKAYVVESELRGVQNRVGKIERNASF